MAGAEELLTSAELVAVSHGDELLAQEVLRVNTFIAHARSVQELANLIINLGLSDETSHEIINAFRERTEGMEFDPVVELGRTINNIAAILPPKIDQTDQAALPVASQAAIPIETTEPKQVEAKTPKTRTTPKARAHTPKETPEVKEGIGRLQTALEYLESLTGQKYEAFDISKASELADVIMEFAAIEVRKNSPNHKAIIVGALETTPNTELARSLNLTTAAIRQQKIYITKKVLENPRKDELGPIIEKILSDVQIPSVEILDQTPLVSSDINDSESEIVGNELDLSEQDVTEAKDKEPAGFVPPKYVPDQRPTLAEPLNLTVPQPPTSKYIGLKGATSKDDESLDIETELDLHGQGALVKAFVELLDIKPELEDSLKYFLTLDTRGSLHITGEQKNRVVQRFRDIIAARFNSFYNSELKLSEMEKVALTNTLGWACKDGKNFYFPGKLVSAFTHEKNDDRMQEREEAVLGAYRKLAEAFERARPRPASK